MNKTQEEKMKQLAGELAKDIKTPEDLSAFTSVRLKTGLSDKLCKSFFMDAG